MEKINQYFQRFTQESIQEPLSKDFAQFDLSDSGDTSEALRTALTAKIALSSAQLDLLLKKADLNHLGGKPQTALIILFILEPTLLSEEQWEESLRRCDFNAKDPFNISLVQSMFNVAARRLSSLSEKNWDYIISQSDTNNLKNWLCINLQSADTLDFLSVEQWRHMIEKTQKPGLDPLFTNLIFFLLEGTAQRLHFELGEDNFRLMVNNLLSKTSYDPLDLRFLFLQDNIQDLWPYIDNKNHLVSECLRHKIDISVHPLLEQHYLSHYIQEVNHFGNPLKI